MAHTRNLIVVCGPTGSGKTDLGVALAARLGTVVLSADSRQVYRGMAIGTAQPDAAQLAAVKHYMVANHDIGEHYTCGHYEREALDLLETLFEAYGTVVAVGGSGLYINALCHGMDKLPEADHALRQQLEAAWAQDPAGLLDELRQSDPAYYEKVDRANPQRVIRAIEVCRLSGTPYSALRSHTYKKRDFNILKIGIDFPREELYRRIDLRVERMKEAGLEAEARALYPYRAYNALRTVGYRELFDYFDGTATLGDAVDMIKRNSRRYAKRQMTWFTKDDAIHWFAPGREENIFSLVEGFLRGEHV